MEKDKKFKNLNSQYKNYLEEISKILSSYEVKKEYSFQELNLIYNMISNINEKNLIIEKDIDNLFKNYEKSNIIISKLEDLLKKRNKIIIKSLLNSDLYKNFINKLSIEYKKSYKIIDSIILELLKKYSMSWKCCWSFLEINLDGIVKKIELFDLNDINFIREKLNINK